MEKILISAGVVLSLGGVWLMIRSRLYDGAEIVSGPKRKWLYTMSWILLAVGVIAQVVGIWFAEVFPGVSSSFASTRAVNSLTESGKSFLDRLKQIQPIIYSLVAFFTGWAATAA